MTAAADANQSLNWSYDAQGRVLSKEQTVTGLSKTVGYTYTNGDLTQILTPSGQTIGYAYSNGRIASITVNGSMLVSSVTYEPFGPVSGWTWGNGAAELRSYDADGNVTAVDSAESYTYSYNDAFRITGITDNDNSALSQTYGYDALDRLTSATGTNLNESWTYDANGNRLSQGGSAASTYGVSNASNQITGITGAPSRSYPHAASGQVTSTGSLSFTYWDSGRMATATSSSGTTSYIYNALGQRVKKRGPGGTEYFVYDEVGHLLGEYDSAGNLIQETVWMDDTPVATIQPSGSGVAIFYIHPHGSHEYAAADHPPERQCHDVALGQRSVWYSGGQSESVRPRNVRLQPAVSRPVLRCGVRAQLQLSERLRPSNGALRRVRSNRARG